METKIKWNTKFFGVEIKQNDIHFVISANPSYTLSWIDAVRFYKDNKVWQLPTSKHLKLIAEHIDEVNDLIKANGGYKMQGWHWTADEYDEFYAWNVYMYNGYTNYYDKYYNDYVRPIHILNINI